jgi:hypothetical protein
VSRNPQRTLLPWGSGRALATSGTGVLITGMGCITYNEAYETTGSAAASVTFYDGWSANGQVLADYLLAESESTSEILGLHWVQFTEGIYVKTNSGNAAGTILAWTEHDCAAYNGAMFHLAEFAKMELEFRALQLQGLAPQG